MSAPTTDKRIAQGARVRMIELHHGADAPVTIAARQDLAEMQIEAAIQKVVDAAPPLCADQAERLSALLTRGGVR